MNNTERLVQSFSSALAIEPSVVTDSLSYGGGGWDSVAHMRLVAAIETAFNIMLETEDVIGMSSFAKAKEILTKYGIQFELAG